MKKETKTNFTKLTQKKGISLIVLIVTIIVIIILAAAVILTLSKNNPIESAREATFKEDVRAFQDELALSISKEYTEKQGQRDEKITETEFDEIKKYIPSFTEKYEGKFIIENDKLVYIDNSIEKEKKWCNDLSITISISSKANPVTDWEYTIDESSNTITLTKYIGTSEKLVIPEEYNINEKSYKVKLLPVHKGNFAGWGYTFTGPLVNCVGYNEYEGNGLNLKEIILENKVSTIEPFTFYGCSNVEKIIIPDSVISVGDHAFTGCSSLTSVILPESITTIDVYAFDRCSSLTSITLPSKIKVISNNLFSGCSNLEKVVIPDGITCIGGYSFSNCSSLVNIEIPSTVNTIDERAFWGCTALESVVIPNGVTVIENHTFNNCSSLKNVTIPNSVTTIEEGAFLDGNKYLENIYFKGTKSEWQSVSKELDWKYCENVVNIICTDGNLSE